MASIKILILPGQLRKFCIKTKIPFFPLLLMQSLHNCTGKLSIFVASKVISFNFYGTKSLWKNYKIMKQFIINICFKFFFIKGKNDKKFNFDIFEFFAIFAFIEETLKQIYKQEQKLLNTSAYYKLP